ncbi:threonine/homoserine/homoserine lactone efflux protein [Rhodopseudomonas julia]|uniref:Threonine/homoserine/homoserine lactone efflux protein n=1 Tax=Rhodopseudomonas julia TaxID=200617 RepID=A0ABU0C435_9BRAD|nr:LysE family translocator [Rhodopseudomonas julia]MDQ0325240.1 threonine/homoserine/homoserine lactone efflux protein [Rhodopseudomonas julia]
MLLDPLTLTLFAGALFINAGTPGPSVTALVSRVLTRGWRDVLPFAAAMWIGEVLWLAAAVFGLATLAQSFFWAFAVVKFAGAAYLIYLAFKMWNAPARVETEDGTPSPRGSALKIFLAGFAVTMGNPKIMVFYLALLPNLLDLESLSLAGWGELSLTLLLVLAAIDLSYIALAGQVRRFLQKPAARRVVNRISALFLGGAAAAIATR